MKPWSIWQIDGEPHPIMSGNDRFWALELCHAWNKGFPEHRYAVLANKEDSDD